MKFAGFSQESLNFLKNVRINNSKEWFENNRHIYDKYLLQPFKDLVCDLSGYIHDIDPLIEVRPAINKTISRIYRDIRFSKDKSLFKNRMWLTFKRPKKEWRDAPAYFFEISPESYRYGMGYYSATKDSMDIFRQMIDENPENFNKLISFFSKQDTFIVEGEEYKRKLDPKKSPNINLWYNRKNLYIVHNNKQINKLYTKDITESLIDGFNILSPIYNYLFQVESRKLEGKIN